LVKPTSGTATICGYDLAKEPEKVRLVIGYVSQTGGLERSASGRENLVLQAQLYGMSKHAAEIRAQELIERFELDEFADRLVDTYSGGQRRKVDIALGMVHRPHLLFLDEPTVGLDPRSRALLWAEIRKLKEAGTTIFLTTHYLDEADHLSDRIAIIDQGHIVAMGTPNQLKTQISGELISIGLQEELADFAAVEAAFKADTGVKEITHAQQTIRLNVEQGDLYLPAVLKKFDSLGITISKISFNRPSLDDVFLKKTGRSLAGDL
jgi:ABC-2 type transport system ATP-binding protein